MNAFLLLGAAEKPHLHGGGGLVAVFQDAVLITAFVAVMMLLVEYLNVRTRGALQKGIRGRAWRQYLLALLLAGTPGCLGAFALVTLFTHRLLSLGALVTGMIVTSGDEAFVMIAKIPGPFILLLGIQTVVGLLAGILTDLFLKRRDLAPQDKYLEIPFHQEDTLPSQSWGEILDRLRHMSPVRGTLATALLLFLAAHLAGQVGPEERWASMTLGILTTLGLLVVLTVPDHFLEEHLWNHVVRIHAPRILLWTLGTMLVIYFFRGDLETLLHQSYGPWAALLLACLVGIIPESGPHLVFVLLYARGDLPFAVLLASSIVQDGHGMLPLLATSRKDFLVVKAINLAAGLLAGALAMI